MPRRSASPFALALAFALSLTLSLPRPAAAAETDPAWPGAEWETSTPAAQGMDAAVLAQLVDYGRNVKMDSLLVVRNGRIVTEAVYAPFAHGMKHRINSATKAVVGALAGIAIARGELPGTDTPVAELVRGDAELAQRWRGMTMQHLLDMTSGMAWNEPLAGPPVDAIAMDRSGQWLQFILQRPIAKPPGSTFNYNSGNPHLLSAAIAQRTGTTTQAYAQQHLFTPIGITAVRWRSDPQGIASGGFGIYLAPRDMARFGLLYLRGGEWQGRQVVPRAWTDRVFAARQPMDFPGYQYADFWWTQQRLRAYMAMGYLGQVILLLPDEGIVVVATGHGFYPVEDLIRNVRRAVRSNGALPPDAAGLAHLRERTAEAAREPAAPAGVPGPRIASGTRYAVPENRLGIQELTLDLDDAAPSYALKVRGPRDTAGARLLRRPVAFNGSFARATEDGGVAVLGRATWTAPDTLLVEQHWPEEATSARYELKFEGELLHITAVGGDGSRTNVTARKAVD
jgi:CubicO group peptidase (beta-lactamase class C family)